MLRADSFNFFVQIGSLGRYRNDINRYNALGHKGELAIEFGELANVMWSQRNRYVVPRMFKSSISNLNPQFAGTQQHDCSASFDISSHAFFHFLRNSAFNAMPPHTHRGMRSTKQAC